MLQFNRRQMSAIGASSMRDRVRGYLLEHLPAMREIDPVELDAGIDDLLADARKQGLRSQRAVATYAMAAAMFGREYLAADPSVREILGNRLAPQTDRALKLELWLRHLLASPQRTTRP